MRQQPQPHDRRLQDVDIPFNALIGDVSIADPMATDPAEMVRNERNELQLSERTKITVTRTLRTDPLAWMHDRGHIELACFEAGRRYQALIEAVEIGGASGIDPTREVVDGGKRTDPLTDRRMRAAHSLERAHKALKQAYRGQWVAEALLVQGLFPRQIARLMYGREEPTTKERTLVGNRCREVLEILALAI